MQALGKESLTDVASAAEPSEGADSCGDLECGCGQSKCIFKVDTLDWAAG